jgi:hypothetical protein
MIRWIHPPLRMLFSLGVIAGAAVTIYGCALEHLETAGADKEILLDRAGSLMPQSGAGGELKTAFNASAGNARLMVMLSPT